MRALLIILFPLQSVHSQHKVSFLPLIVIFSYIHYFFDVIIIFLYMNTSYFIVSFIVSVISHQKRSE